MKYVLLIGDGMADRPLKVLGGKTPLQAANKPNMDAIASSGLVGMVKTVSRKTGSNSDVAIMSILGYDPGRYYTGRGPLEAASMGIRLGTEEIAFRCNLVTVDEDSLVDYSAGHISTKEAKVLIDYLNKKLRWDGAKFYAGVSYRHLAVLNLPKGRFSELNPDMLRCMAPHDVLNKPVDGVFPRGKGSEVLKELMLESKEFLEGHEINQVRRELGENPANMIWLWGQGRVPELPRFEVKGAVISAVDVVKGIGVCAGLSVLDVPGATGYFDTDYNEKAVFAIHALDEQDFVLVHVEAPDEAGHIGDVRTKITAIEEFDSKVVGPVLSHLKKLEGYRLCVMPDHATPIEVRTHVDDAVPFAICGEGINERSGLPFDEISAKKTGVKVVQGYRLMEKFLKK